MFSQRFTTSTGRLDAPEKLAFTPEMSIFSSSAMSMIVWYSAGTPGIHVGCCFFIAPANSGFSGAGSRITVPPISGPRVMFMVNPYAWKIGSAASIRSGSSSSPSPGTHSRPWMMLAHRFRWLSPAPFGTPVVPEV